MVCIEKYKKDIENASNFICVELVKDFKDKSHAYQHAERNETWDSVADWIIGDPTQGGNPVLYRAVAAAAAEHFKVELLGTY